MSATYCEKISRKQKKEQQETLQCHIKEERSKGRRELFTKKKKNTGQKIITLHRYKNALYQETE